MTEHPSFREWWREYPVKISAQMVGSDPLRDLAADAFQAGYLAAVKAHDASGCPGIFYRHEFKLMEPKS